MQQQRSGVVDVLEAKPPTSSMADWLAAVATMQPLLSLVSMRSAGVLSIWRQLDQLIFQLTWHDRFFQNVMFFDHVKKRWPHSSVVNYDTIDRWVTGSHRLELYRHHRKLRLDKSVKILEGLGRLSLEL